MNSPMHPKPQPIFLPPIFFPPQHVSWSMSPPAINNDPIPTTTTSSKSSNSAVTPGVISVIVLLAAAFLLVSYYRIFGRYCAFVLWGNNRRRSPEQLDRSNDVILDIDAAAALPQRSNGVEEALIQKIPVYSFREEDVLIDTTECAVCLGEFQDHEHLRLLPKCGHAFHLPCIDTWLQEHSNCPLCRAPILRIHPDDSELPLGQPQDDQSPSNLVNNPDTSSHQELQSANSPFSARGRSLMYSLSARLACSDRAGSFQLRSGQGSLFRSVSQKGGGGSSRSDHQTFAWSRHTDHQPQKSMQGLLPVRVRFLTRTVSVQDPKHQAISRNFSTMWRLQPFACLTRSNSTGSLHAAASLDTLIQLQYRKPSAIYSINHGSSSFPSAAVLNKIQHSEMQQPSLVPMDASSTQRASSSSMSDLAMKPGSSASTSHDTKFMPSNNSSSTSVVDGSHVVQSKELPQELMKPKEMSAENTGGAGSEHGCANTSSKSSKSGPLSSINATMKRSFSGQKLFHILHGRRHLSEIPRQPI